MFSMCSELTPRAPIPDTRIPQLMQPCLCRPLAAWKNSSGRYEISRETVSVDEEAVELKLVHSTTQHQDGQSSKTMIKVGCDSGEEIARINIPMKDVEKAQVNNACCLQDFFGK